MEYLSNEEIVERFDYECATKPGSPYLCEQCIWVREHYPNKDI